MFFLQDYANLIFWLGLYFAGFVFWLRRFIPRKSCKILSNTKQKLEFWLEPVDFYRFLPIVASIGTFFLSIVLYIAVQPDFARLSCQYNIQNSHDAPHYKCEYLEQNYSGLATKISFNRVDKIKLRSRIESTDFPLHFVLTVSQIQGDGYPPGKIKQLQRFIENLYRATDLKLDSSTEIIYFPIRIERQDYQKWSENKNKIETFIAEYSDRILNIQQDTTAILERKLGKTINQNNEYFLQLGLKIIALLTIFSLLLLAIAPTIKCTIDVDENSFKILRQRFFGRTTFSQSLELNKISGMWLVGEEDLSGSRMLLELKSEEIVPITYIGDNTDSLAKMKVCKIFNNLIASVSNFD